MKLAAVYLVKNEIDIIEANIRYHHNMGVSCFTIMDNGSDDGTRELLASLSKEIPIHIVDKKEQTYQFHVWRKEIVKEAKKVFKPDMVICNDADEFWVPTGDAKLTDLLQPSKSVVTVNRYNMLPPAREQEVIYDAFLNCSYKVVGPINYSKEAQVENPNVGMLLSKIGPKVALNPSGLISLNGGNHRAKHIKFWAHDFNTNINVYHFPVRSFEQFKKNVENRAKVISRKDLKVLRIGDHYRRWARLLESGGLFEEYQKFLFDEKELQLLGRIGVVEEDLSIANYIRERL